MSVLNQFFKPASTAVAANHYSDLLNKRIEPKEIINKINDGSMCPIFHWNAIWHHRVVVELCAQLFENKEETMIIFNDLIRYQKMYNRMYSTMPLRSNKSFSYYLGVVSLDALLDSKYNREKHLKVFHNITTHLVGDGAFIEGSHYSIFCSQSFDRVYELLNSYYGQTKLWLDVCDSMEKLRLWQSRISNKKGVVASIGDSWYERVEPTTDFGVFAYKDMTIHRNKNWTVIEHHRKSPWALHEHPHLDEILVSKGNKWIVQGSGMPSYKQVMARPFRWRRPRNHFYVDKSFDYIWVWRLLKSRITKRNIQLTKDVVQIIDKGYQTIRWPLDVAYKVDLENNIVNFGYNGTEFIVSGDIKSTAKGHSWQSGGYGISHKIEVIIISGKNLITTIK